MRTRLKLRLLDDAGRVFTCASCKHLQTPSEDDCGDEVYGRCTFHDMTFDQARHARGYACTSHTRNGYVRR